MQYKLKTINNITTLFIPMEGSNSTTVQVFFKAGSIYENEKNNGISHFLEHMFFKGSKDYPTAKIQTQSIENFGGEVNAFTSREYTGYYIKSAPEFTEKSIKILSDMLINPLFPAEEIEKEKGVVIQEIMMYNDNPAKLVMDKSDLAFLGDTSYGRTVLGTEKNVNILTQEQLFAHKNNLYTKDNSIVVIAGKIEDEDKMTTLVEQHFSDLPEKKQLNKPPFERSFPKNSQDFFDKKTEQNHLVISAMGYSGNKKERYAAKVLATILGGNMSSRLFQEIREKEGLCYYIHASHSTQNDYGMFLIRAGLQKDKFDFAKEKIAQELEKIAQEGVSQQEFNNVLGFLKGSIQMGIETSDEAGYFLGMQHLLYNEITDLEEVLKIYQQLSLEEVNATAKKLTKENLFWYWIE